MKKRLLIALFIATFTSVRAQEEGTLRLMLRGGYTSFDLQDVKSFMGKIISDYNSYGIPARLQTAYPANFLFGGELQRVGVLFRFGVGMHVTKTMAFSGYRDGAGELRLRSDVSVTAAYAVIGVNVAEKEGVEFYLSVKPGYAFGSWEMREQVTFTEFSSANSDEKIKGSSAGLTVEGVMGASMWIAGSMTLEGEVGYRAGGNHKIFIGEQETNLGLNTEGFVLNVMLGLAL